MNSSLVDAHVWVFDNDNTLYSDQNGCLQKAVMQKIHEYIARYYSTSIEDAIVVRQNLLKRHQARSTVVAFYREGTFDINQFIEETYLAVSIDDFDLKRTEPLFDLLQKIEGEKWVITNSPSCFARSILAKLGYAKTFDHVLGIQELGFNEKPEQSAYKALQPYLSVGKRVVFIDDTLENLVTAIEIGCTGIFWDRELQTMRRIP